MQQMREDLATLKGIVDQLGAQMQLTKVDLGNVTAANINEMKKFEDLTVKEVIKMKEDINSTVVNANATVVNATQEFEAQRQNQANGPAKHRYGNVV